jgi:hypothetical protein
MQRGRHIDAFGEIVRANKIDVLRGQIGTDALQKIAQVRAGCSCKGTSVNRGAFLFNPAAAPYQGRCPIPWTRGNCNTY